MKLFVDFTSPYENNQIKLRKKRGVKIKKESQVMLRHRKLFIIIPFFYDFCDFMISTLLLLLLLSLQNYQPLFFYFGGASYFVFSWLTRISVTAILCVFLLFDVQLFLMFNYSWCAIFDVQLFLMFTYVWCSAIFDVHLSLMFSYFWCSTIFNVLLFLMFTYVWCSPIFDVHLSLMFTYFSCSPIFHVQLFLMFNYLQVKPFSEPQSWLLSTSLLIYYFFIFNL